MKGDECFGSSSSRSGLKYFSLTARLRAAAGGLAVAASLVVSCWGTGGCAVVGFLGANGDAGGLIWVFCLQTVFKKENNTIIFKNVNYQEHILRFYITFYKKQSLLAEFVCF